MGEAHTNKETRLTQNTKLIIVTKDIYTKIWIIQMQCNPKCFKDTCKANSLIANLM